MNILLQTLSLLNSNSYTRKPTIFKCNYDAKSRSDFLDGDKGERYFSQCEPALLSVANELHKLQRPETIDKIIVFCSPETYDNPYDEKTDERNRYEIPMAVCFNGEDKTEIMNSLMFYEKRIEFLLNKRYTYEVDGNIKDIYETKLKSKDFILFEKISDGNRFERAKSNEKLVIEIAKIIREIFDEEADSRLYIDTQGGSRSDMFFLLSIVRLLKIRGINPERILLCDFNINEKFQPVYDKKKEYSVFDLPSGIDEFINYAKAKQLKKFFTESGATSNDFIRETLKIIEDIANAIQICNMDEFRESLGKLREKCDNKDSANNELFKYVLEEIKNDYEELLQPGGDTFLNIINWCIRKEFYQQALTLLESDTAKELAAAGVFDVEYIISELEKDELEYGEKSIIKEHIKRNNQNKNLWEKQCDNQHNNRIKYVIDYYIRRLMYNDNNKLIRDTFYKVFRNGLYLCHTRDNVPYFKVDRYETRGRIPPIIRTRVNIDISVDIYYKYLTEIKDLRNSTNHGDSHISFSDYVKTIKDFVKLLERAMLHKGK